MKRFMVWVIALIFLCTASALAYDKPRGASKEPAKVEKMDEEKDEVKKAPVKVEKKKDKKAKKATTEAAPAEKSGEKK